MLYVFSLLSKFPFVEIHPSVDIYAIVRLNIYTLPFPWRWKDVEICTLLMSGGKSRLTSAARCVSGDMSLFK